MISSRGQGKWQAVSAGRSTGQGRGVRREGKTEAHPPESPVDNAWTDPEVHPKPESQKRHAISMVTLHLSQQELTEDVYS